MDQAIIGKFIASERKQKGYTQRQLAELLGISDKTISKWETGRGFPDASLLLPLCNELGITVNELLAGERVPKEEYQKMAEETMVGLVKEREENKKKAAFALITGILSIIAFVTLILVVCTYSEAIPLPVKRILVGVACGIFALGLAAAMEGGRTIGYYQCKACGELFVPSFREYLARPQLITAKYLRCPVCGKRTWCKKVLSKKP